MALRVVGRRQDGYHLLQTVMTFFPLFDTLELTVKERSRGLHLTCTPPVTQNPAQNLALRAAKRLLEQTGVGHGVHIHLRKRIPAGGGLGGGSSDAATVLLALNLPLPTLIDIGVGLGADIPIFLGGYAALAEGVGEKLTPLPDLARGELVVINPGVTLSTQAVFQQMAGVWPHHTHPLQIPMAGKGDLAPFLENDLEPPARKLAPIVDDIITRLLAEGARASRMSGSGSSVFGLFSDAESAKQAAKRIKNRQPGWIIHYGQSFNKHPFAKEWASGLEWRPCRVLGRGQAVKAPDFDSGIPRFESWRPSQFFEE